MSAMHPEVAGGAEAGQNEYLDFDIHQLMEITVFSASKRAQPLSEVPAAMAVISQEDIQRSGVTTLAAALALAPGLHVAQISASKWSVASRGFPGSISNKLLILIDGRSLYSPGFSGTLWDSQNVLLEDVDRIEVIRGPGGTIWGANAVNGIINVITKSSRDTQQGLLRIGAGNEERLLTGLRYGGRLSPSTTGRLSATYSDHGANVLQADGTDAHDGWRPAQLGFRVDGQPHVQTSWTVQGDHQEGREEILIYPYWSHQFPYGTRSYDEAEVISSNLLGRWQKTFAADETLTVQTYYDRNCLKETSYEQDSRIFNWDGQLTTSWGKQHALIMGAGYRFIDLSFLSSTQLMVPDAVNHLYNGFVQDTYSLHESLQFTLGIKYEYNNYTYGEWQPSGKVLWKMAPGHTVWASLARAVRTPTVLEREGEVLAGMYASPQGSFPVTIRGNEDFISETVLAYEGGYRWQVAPNLGLDLSVFINDYDELYALAPDNAPQSYGIRVVNGLEGQGYGAELAVDWKALSWLQLNMSYSYLELDLQESKRESLDGMAEYYEKNTPTHQLQLRSSLALAPDWQVNMWIRYVDAVSGRDSLDALSGRPVAIGPSFFLSANIIWTLNEQLEVMVAGNNLLQEQEVQYTQEVFTPPVEIERSVYAKLTWRF